jgi:adenosylcobinamide kinase/adenosylcobinamide-phosphate guanylyltransferase
VDTTGTFLVDSVTTLVTNELYPPEKNYETDEAGAQRCGEELLEFIRRVRHAVVVSDDLSRDALHFDPATEAFRRHLGAIHRKLAKECDVVMEMAFGNLLIHKGEWE